jgi:branched-chain amino acid transport system substrate-binding protein
MFILSSHRQPASILQPRLTLLLTLLTGMLFTAACNSQMPPLPDTPDTPDQYVAILSPTTGELATQGQSLRNGIQLAFDQWNRSDNAAERGYQLTWRLYHTDCQYETAKQVTRQAIADGAQFIIGPICSEAAIAAAEEASTAQAILVVPTATHPLVTTDRNGNTRQTVFRVGYTALWQGESVARFSTTQNFQRAAILYSDQNRYSTNLAYAFQQSFEASGGTIVYTSTLPTDTSEIPAIPNSVNGHTPDIVYLPIEANQANQVVGLFTQTNPTRQILGCDMWDSPDLDVSLMTGQLFPVQYTPLNP